MSLNPELIVLSACNTGYGTLARGEGMLSLSYSFAYAGCKSQLVSHWQVDDESTYQLMLHFYRFLENGFPKNEAIRLAKLAYLKEVSEFKSSPYYWGGFSLIGDTSPIVFHSTSKLYWIFIVFLLMVIGALIYRRRQVRSVKGY